ncbi:MAG: S1 RNA-binding domain-containing protein, partial [Deltaproteobacteria bacterium]|nr:S1 RNA-binding domain-containing protein [Deltaproteobacteria bacterium]
MEGVEGLVHISEIDQEIPKEKLSEFYKINSLIRAKVLKVDVEERRLGLGIIGLVENPEEVDQGNNILKGAMVNAGMIDANDSDAHENSEAAEGKAVEE